MNAPELSRPVRIDALGTAPRDTRIEAGPDERAALARRFGLRAIDRLEAEVDVRVSEGEPVATGRVSADVVQSCSITGEPVPARIDEEFAVVFRAETPAGEDEVELGEGDLDVIFHDGASIDIGEAVAQTLALALDPYPRAPGAEAALREAGVKDEGEAGPFGALAGLRDKLSD